MKGEEKYGRNIAELKFLEYFLHLGIHSQPIAFFGQYFSFAEYYFI